MNLSLTETGGEMLLVSQFTLAADTRKGLRPSFTTAAPPELGERLFDVAVDHASVLLPGQGRNWSLRCRHESARSSTTGPSRSGCKYRRSGQPSAHDDCRIMTDPFCGPRRFPWVSAFANFSIILLIALVLFGAKKLKTVGSDLGSAVRGFKKAMSDGEDEQNKQLSELTGGKDADFTDEVDRKAGQQAERLSLPCSRSASPRSS